MVIKSNVGANNTATVPEGAPKQANHQSQDVDHRQEQRRQSQQSSNLDIDSAHQSRLLHDHTQSWEDLSDADSDNDLDLDLNLDLDNDLPEQLPALQTNKSLENYDGIPREYDTIQPQLLPDSAASLSSSGGKTKKKKAPTPGHLRGIKLLNPNDIGKVPLKDQLRGLQRELSGEAGENEELRSQGADKEAFRNIPTPPTLQQQQQQPQQQQQQLQIPVNEPFYFDSDEEVFSPPPPPLPQENSSLKSSKSNPSQNVQRNDRAQKKSNRAAVPPSSIPSYSQQLQVGAMGGQRLYVAPQESQMSEEDRALEEKFAELIIDKTRIERIVMIGEGYFGEVWRGVWDGSQAVALKCLKHGVKNTVDKNKFFSEVSSLAKMRHPNITVFYGATAPPEAYIISELLQCSLFQLIYSHKHKGNIRTPSSNQSSSATPLKPFPLKAILRILSDVSYGGNYLHNMKPNPVIHRDLTSSNVLLTIPANISEVDLITACEDTSKPVAKLTDFGLSREVDWCMTACVGNLFYLAPEVYTGEHYTQSADIYSFGILMWELVSRESPHGGVNPQRVAFLAATQNLRPPLNDSNLSSEPFRALNRRCWHADPQQRPSFRDVAMQLQSFRNAQLPTPPVPTVSPSLRSEESEQSYHAFSGTLDVTDRGMGTSLQQQESKGSPDSWQKTRRRLDAFLLNRPTMKQMSEMGAKGLIEHSYFRDYQEDAARSLAPGNKDNPMHQVLAALPEKDRPQAIRDMLLKRSSSQEAKSK